MKLQTQVPARRDGTLTAQGMDGVAYVFKADTEADGVLTGEVEHEPTVAHLLRTGNFYPADPADFEAAERLAGDAEPDASGDEDDGHDDEQDDGPGEDDEVVNGGMPVEANSPLRPAPSAKAGGRPRKAK